MAARHALIGIRPGSGLGLRWHVELREEVWLGDDGVGGADIANTQVLVGLGFGLKDTREPMFERGSRTLIRSGISATRLEAKGYGETRPMAPNDTDAGRARNRRVELKRVD